MFVKLFFEQLITILGMCGFVTLLRWMFCRNKAEDDD